jgi:ribonucleoside-triphosphate reductase
MPESNRILSDRFLTKYKNKQPNWGYNGLGGIVYRRTYSRIKDDGTNEDWWETIARCVEGAQAIGADYTKEEAESLYDKVFNLKCNFAGRMLWQLGTPTVKRFGANSLLNCWNVSVNELRAFEFIFENLMLGGGVGFSIRKEDVHELPRVKEGVSVTAHQAKDADFIVPDSREGWVKLLHEMLQAFFVTGRSFTYSTILIRSAGEKISGFGGTASGPKILVDGITKMSDIIKSREGKKLRTIDVLDICNIIGSIVVAGNVRRSAQIALGDPDDHYFIRAKNWSLGNIPNSRAMSNNTIYADQYSHISNDLWENGFTVDPATGMAKGEPYGFFNLPLSQRYGRTKDGLMKESNLYATQRDNCVGTNPCGEISLASYECCNLSELYLNNIESEDELIECATLLYKTQKAICALPFLHKETEAIVHKNMRIGLGVTGVCQSLGKVKWLDKCYRELRRFDKEWSKKKGWPQSIKLTTVKPSGTLSLLAGATPGVHPGFSQYYIRRVRMGSNDSLVKTCRELGYHVEYVVGFDGQEDHTTVVVEFPCESGSDAILTKDMSAIKQLELVKTLQAEWADNAVSVTVYYKPEELDGIKKWLEEHYEKNIKSVSFLLHSQHGFRQAPYEEISKDRYTELRAKVKPLVGLQSDITGGDLAIDSCASGACPIK